MPYVEQTLLPGERVVHCGQIHWAIFLPRCIPIFVGVPLGLVWVANVNAMFAGVDIHVADPIEAKAVFYARITPIVISILFGCTGLLLLLAAWIRQFTTEIAVTDQRLIIKVGAISRKTIEMNLAKIENIQVEQGILGRLLRYGTITVVGTGGTREPFRWIVDPLAFRKAVQAQSHG